MRALIAAADGCEEIETLSTYDFLKRAGIEVCLASIKNENYVEAAHGLKFITDTTLAKEFEENFDVIVLPGGLPGSVNLQKCEILISMLKRQQKEGRWIAAICAAPGFVLGSNNLIGTAKYTGYPGTCNQVTTGTFIDQGICVDVDHKLITAQGPAFATAFALTIVTNLCGQEIMEKVAKDALVSH